MSERTGDAVAVESATAETKGHGWVRRKAPGAKCETGEGQYTGLEPV